MIDIDSGETVSRGFAMPHSPRIAMGRLWVLNSGAGQLGTIDVATGRFEPVASFPGFTRGLAFHGQFAFVGLSKIRETSVFGGMPIEKDRANLRCGVGVVDLVSGQQVAMLQFHSGVDEIFAVSVIPGSKRPCIVGPNETDSSRTDIWIVPTSAAAPGQLKEHAAVPVRSDNLSPEAKAAQLVAQAEHLQRKGQLREAVQLYHAALQIEPTRSA